METPTDSTIISGFQKLIKTKYAGVKYRQQVLESGLPCLAGALAEILLFSLSSQEQLFVPVRSIYRWDALGSHGDPILPPLPPPEATLAATGGNYAKDHHLSWCHWALQSKMQELRGQRWLQASRGVLGSCTSTKSYFPALPLNLFSVVRFLWL